jgi:hypothetical protein
MLRDLAEQQNEAFLIPSIKCDLVIQAGINQGLSSKRLGATLRKPQRDEVSLMRRPLGGLGTPQFDLSGDVRNDCRELQ